LGRLIDAGAISREPQGRSAVLEITEKGKNALSLLEPVR
jgi:predicted transcriptional regulator